MKNLIVLLSILFTAIFLLSCEDSEEVDVNAPEILLMSPSYGQSIAAGTELHFHAEFKDDIALATFNLSIHNNFDGHSHGRVKNTPWDISQSYEISGKVNDFEVDIPVPVETTAGPYHLTIQTIDAAGNSTSFSEGTSVEAEVWFTNDEMAEIHFEDASGNELAEIDAVAGSAISVTGHIEDLAGTLDHVDVMIGHMEEGHDHSHDHDHDHARTKDEMIYEKMFEVEGKTMVELADLLANETISVSQAEVDALEAGEHLYLIVKVKDVDGNISRNAVEIHFE